MKHTLSFSADQLFEVQQGLELRIAFCEKKLARVRSAKAKTEWDHQLFCARRALAHVEDTQSQIRVVPFGAAPAG
jgi:hypothetical protein